MQPSSTISDYSQTFAMLLLLGLAALLFGADTASASYLVSGLILLLCAVTTWRNPETRPGWLVSAMVVVWLVLAGLHGLNGLSVGRGDHYLMVLTLIVAFWMGAQTGTGNVKPRRIWTMMLIFGLLYSGYAFSQHIVSRDEIFGMDRPYHMGRLSASFLSSNTAATYLSMISLVAAAHIYRDWQIQSSKYRGNNINRMISFLQSALLGILTLLFSFSSLLLTASRAGVTLGICFLAVFGFWIYLRSRKSESKSSQTFSGLGLLVFAFLTGVGAFFWIQSGSGVSQRYGTLIEDFEARRQTAMAAWKAFQYEPIFGHGLGRFNEAKLLGVDPISNYTVMGQNAVHNFYLQILVQTGISGLVIVTCFYVVVISSMLKAIFRRRRYSTYIIGILLVSFFVCAHGMFDYGLDIPAVALLHCWLIGIGYGLSVRHNS